MGKKLSEMTLEELWDLFPIFLVPYDSKWNEYYNEMEISIERLLSDYPVDRISHIGSTAIHNIGLAGIAEVRAAHRRLRFPFCRRLLAWQRASARAFPEGCGESCPGQPFPLLVDSGQPLSRLLLPEQQFSAGCGKSLSGDAGIRSAAGRAADPCALSDARFLRPDRDCSGSHGSGFWSDPGSFRSRPARIQANRGCRRSGKYVEEM